MPDAVPPLAGHRILVVEDEYLIATEVKRWLQAAGSEVLGPVPTVERALDLIDQGRPDAAVLDVNLGGGHTVYPVASELDALKVPYLFATGDVKMAGADVCRGHPRLEKPYLKAELVRAVLKLLSGVA
ncbi:response regulator [Methylobacterium sp. 2A]|uniref:response regulator n=1 Tax=Methylobacterium sp. 2A TaxID=2603816 RepID=UPI001371D303